MKKNEAHLENNEKSMKSNEQRLENNVNSLKNNENIFTLLKNHWMPSRIFLKTFQDKINKVRMPPGFLTRYACVF